LRTTNTKMRLIFAIAAAFDILNIIGIFVWFFLQHNLNLIADDILHFNIAASLIDVVGVSAFRAVLILILYVIIAIDTLMPLIVSFIHVTSDAKPSVLGIDVSVCVLLLLTGDLFCVFCLCTCKD